MMTAMQLAKEDLDKAERELAAINASDVTSLANARDMMRKALDRYQVAAGLSHQTEQVEKESALVGARATLAKKKAAYDDFLLARTSKREEMEKTFAKIFGQLFEIIDSDNQLSKLTSEYCQASQDAGQQAPRTAMLAKDFLGMVRRPVLVALSAAQSSRQSPIHWLDVLRILELER